MVSRFILKLPVKCVSIRCLLDLLLALATLRGTKKLVGKKTDQVARVQSRLAYNRDGSVHN